MLSHRHFTMFLSLTLGQQQQACMCTVHSNQQKSLTPIVAAIHYCKCLLFTHFVCTVSRHVDYIVIYSNSPSSGGYWDVSSSATLTHNGGGDSQTIINMVTYAVNNYGGDANRVYATGTTSGAMMTNVLAGLTRTSSTA
jgi:acetylxylan esterase